MVNPYVSASAQQDIASILEWTHEHFGIAAEARYADLIAAAIDHAAADPSSPGFHRRHELEGDLLTWHLSQSVLRSADGRVRKPRHFLLYRWKDGRLEIARLMHEVQDPTLHFDPDVDWE